MIIKRFLVLFFSVTAAIAFGQTTAPKYSNEFLNIGVGARAFGMGSAQTSVASDITAGYWNPAGLLEMKSKYELGLMHSEYFAGIAKYDYGAVGTLLDSTSAIALSVIRFGVDDIPDTRFLYDANGAINYNNVKFFSAADYAFLVSYAKSIPRLKGIKTGANFKVIHRIVGDFASAWGFGLDLGAKYNKGTWGLGVMARDITSTFNAWSHNTEMVKDVYQQTGNELPSNALEITLPKLIIGANKYLSIKKKVGFLMTADLISTFDGKRNTVVKTDFISVEPAAGLEIDYKKTVFLRGGVGNFQRIEGFDKNYTSFQPNFGVGLRVYKFTLDYALTNLGNTSESLYSNVFSLKVNLN
jgi:hypothetical protein